jgi:hypothetical protein
MAKGRSALAVAFRKQEWILSENSHRTRDPHALKMLAPKGAESTLTENAASLFQAEPTQGHEKVTRQGTVPGLVRKVESLNQLISNSHCR